MRTDSQFQDLTLTPRCLPVRGKIMWDQQRPESVLFAMCTVNISLHYLPDGIVCFIKN